MTNTIAIPFSKRTTAAVTVFPCLFICGPNGAQALPFTVNSTPAMVPLGSDNFTRADENPLSDGGKWTVPADGTPLQVLSDVCVGTAYARCVEAYTGASLPSNQYAKYRIGALDTFEADSVFLYTRFNFSTTQGYVFELDVQAGGPGNGLALLYRDYIGNPLTTPLTITVTTGDVFVLSAVGSAIVVTQNGTPILSGIDSTYTSGSAGLGIEIGD